MPDSHEIAEFADNDIVRKLMWTGLLAATSAVAAIAAKKSADLIWVKLFAEEPPE